jgi:ATP-binding cassette subfamily B protein
VVENLRRLGKTVVLVSHRISSLVDCDRIYVFKDGKVVEFGIFKGLIERNGIFSLLYQAQREGVVV